MGDKQGGDEPRTWSITVRKIVRAWLRRHHLPESTIVKIEKRKGRPEVVLNVNPKDLTDDVPPR